jgi:hypothetical protein
LGRPRDSQELVIVTAFILFQRFFTFQSFRQHDRKVVVAGKQEL